MIDDLTVIIITFQEEAKIRSCIESVQSVTSNIFVVDSYSTDRTQEILSDMEVRFVEHEFTTYAEKRNWSQKNNPFQTDWVMHLDADERFTPELIKWFANEFVEKRKKYNGFLFSRKTIFMNKWIKHGGQYPNYHARLFREHLGHCEDKEYDQHFIIDSDRIETIADVDIINIVTDNIDDLIRSHNNWATKEAKEILAAKRNLTGEVKARMWGNAIERRRWLKRNIFEKAPLFYRSFIYFNYRYFIRGGFLDGKEGLIFFFLQTFWFRFLVDAKVFEMTKDQSSGE